MNKARIVIASVLKPVTEPRAFAKLALSMCETNKYHLNIIGFYSKKAPILEDIQFTCIFNRHRSHFFRALAPLKFLVEIFKYKPNLVIVSTYELVPMALIGKFFLKYKLIYDLQENYHKNVLLNNTVPFGLRQLLSLFIQTIEKSAHPFIDHYFFAEQSYSREFPYILRFTILENKYPGKVKMEGPKPLDEDRSTLIISGTITPVYGIENAIRWFLSLHREFPGLSLKIMGHVPLQNFKKQLEELAIQHPQVKLNLSTIPIPYPDIQEEILKADIVLMPYENISSIQSKIPTKLYESIALQKPILISTNPLWQEIIDPYPAGIAVDFLKISEAKTIYKKLMTTPLYLKIPGPEVTWGAEKPKLLQAIEGLLFSQQ
ncbi:MAG: glycosyltransferase [Anditalea sp.]